MTRMNITRMHCSRMRTARLLTIPRSIPCIIQEGLPTPPPETDPPGCRPPWMLTLPWTEWLTRVKILPYPKLRSKWSFSRAFKRTRNVYLNLMRPNNWRPWNRVRFYWLHITDRRCFNSSRYGKLYIYFTNSVPGFLHWIGSEFCVVLIEQSSVCSRYWF